VRIHQDLKKGLDEFARRPALQSPELFSNHDE
jgi:hypothetical protein